MSDGHISALLWAVLATIAAIFFLIESVGNRSDLDTLKAEAVECGHAEWLVNPKNGTTTWQWREKQQ